MAICGYNFKIGNGLNTLFNGMIDSMEEKSVKSNDLKVLDDEIRELEIMIEKMQNQGAIQDIFIGLNTFAKHFFTEIRKQIVLNPSLSLREVADKLAPAFIMTVKGAENFRNELEQTEKQNDDIDFEIKQVANWVNANGRYVYDENIELHL